MVDDKAHTLLSDPLIQSLRNFRRSSLTRTMSLISRVIDVLFIGGDVWRFIEFGNLAKNHIGNESTGILRVAIKLS